MLLTKKKPRMEVYQLFSSLYRNVCPIHCVEENSILASVFLWENFTIFSICCFIAVGCGVHKTTVSASVSLCYVYVLSFVLIFRDAYVFGCAAGIVCKVNSIYLHYLFVCYVQICTQTQVLICDRRLQVVSIHSIGERFTVERVQFLCENARKFAETHQGI